MDPEDRLDEDFMFYLSVSERNWKKLQNEKDQELSQEWLYKLTGLQATRADKRDRNVYLSQLALAMADGELSGPFLKRPPEGSLPAPSEVFGPPQPRIEVPPEFQKVDRSEDLTTSYTSKDGRTYVATKSLGKDHGAYTYIGISLADQEPLWVGGDAPTGPCFGFERHFEKPQTLYSKPRPRPASTIYTTEKEGGSGDSPDDTRVFTDYVTEAKAAQMSGTHSKDFQPGAGTVIPLPDAGQRKTLKAAKSPRPEIADVSKSGALPQPTGPLRIEVGPSGALPQPTGPPEAVPQPGGSAEADKDKQIALRAPYLEGLDIMFPLPTEEDTAITDQELNVSDFYTTMITNLNNSLSGIEDLNEYNKKKAEEVKKRNERMKNKLAAVEVLGQTKDALVRKLKRIKEQEARYSKIMKELEYDLLSTTTDPEDIVVQKAWNEACKEHDPNILKLIEDVYNPVVRERMTHMLTLLELKAVNIRSKHMKAQIAAVREDFKIQTEKLQAKIKVSKDLIARTQAVIDEAASLRPTDQPPGDNSLVERRNLAEKLTAEVDQLMYLCDVEQRTCQNIEKEIFNTSDNVFSNSEFVSIAMDNMRLKSGIEVLSHYLDT